jgi:hypothetical protein
MSQPDDPQCTGPFSNAFDCPVHNPLKRAEDTVARPAPAYWCSDCDLPIADVPTSHLHTRDGHGVIALPPRLRQQLGAITAISVSRQVDTGQLSAHAGLLRRLEEQLVLCDMGYSERFDYQAEKFYRETGFMAPGKSVPLEMASSQQDSEREQAWRVFQDGLRDEWKATIREARDTIAQARRLREALRR